MKHTAYITVFVISALLLSSCEKMLDIPQKGVTSTDSFYSTDEEAEEAVVAIYDAYSSSAFNNGFYTINMLDDDSWASGDNRQANVDLEALNEFRYTSSNNTVQQTFANNYTIIYRCNLILDNVAPDTEIKKRAIAEAYFFRAYAYLQLVTYYGPVPLVEHVVLTGDYAVPNSTIDAIYGLIESDLVTAIDMDVLPEKSNIDDNITGRRVTKQTAQALLGKAYLFCGKEQEAADVLDEVIESGKYGLFQGEYGNIFSSSNNFNREIMLAVNKTNDPNKYSFCAYNVFHGWRVDRFDGLVSSGIDVYNAGWGFGTPTKDLYDAFVEMEGVDGYRLNQTLITYDQLVEKGVTIISGKFVYGCEGYWNWKQRNTLESHVEGTMFGFYNNEVTMRYAEVLLLAAEANLNINPDKATKYLNEIRERAKLPALDHAVTLDDIKKEKRLELCFENLRFVDLVRWGDAAEVLKDKGKYYATFYGYKEGTDEYNIVYTETGAEYGFKAGKHELLPIPRVELEVNPLIEQNPGWAGE